jgi:RNA polymerase sigma-70 factor (ECF subfamily)
VQVEDLALVADSAPTEDESQEYRDSELLMTAMKQLPARQRAAIAMLKLGEMPMRDVVMTSGRSAGALRISVHRAMTTLRSALTAGIDGPLGPIELAGRAILV